MNSGRSYLITAVLQAILMRLIDFVDQLKESMTDCQ